MRHLDVRTAPVRVLYIQAPGYARTGLPDRLRPDGFAVTMTAEVGDALGLLADERFDICLVDLAGGRSALTTVRLVRARHPALSVAGVVDPAFPEVTTDAVRAGLVDLLTWPFDPIELMAVVTDGRDRAPASPRRARADDGLVAFSPAMRELLRQVRTLAMARAPVLLTGESGTGKRLVARRLHEASSDAPAPFVALDFATTEQDGLDAELTAAMDRARGGTLVVSHVDAAPVAVQRELAKMLRTLDERPGETSVRVIATRAPSGGRREATLHPELDSAFPIDLEVPALRRRREDIPMLAAWLLERGSEVSTSTPVRFSRAALELLAALPWPGNMPELERTIEAVRAGTRRPVVQIEDLLRHVSLDGARKSAGATGLRKAREQFERECIEAALARHQGRVGEAARALGIQRTNLYRKVRQLGIPKSLLASQR